MKKILIITLIIIALTSFISCENNNNNSSKITETKEYLNIIEADDKLLFNIDDSYLFCTKDSEYEISLPNKEYIRNYQTFLSDSGEIIFYNTNSSNTNGELKHYHIDKNENGNLLEDMNIEIEGYVSLVSYKSDKIIVLCGDLNEEHNKIETKTLIEIDLKGETHRKIELPFTPNGAWAYNGLTYLGDNIGVLCSNQVLVILDKDGNIINEIEINEKDTMCNISSSPDGSKFTYQTGTSPVDLNLYDLENKTSKTLFSSENAFCISSAWGIDSKNLYYITYEDTSKDYKLHVLEEDEL